MRVGKEKATDITLARGSTETAAKGLPSKAIDFNVFGAKEIRDLLKNKAHCLRAGFPPDHIFIAIFNEIRDCYLRKVGLPTYLSQMLGNLGTARIDQCTLYSEDSRPIRVDLKGGRNQPIQRFIAKQFGWDNLPFMVEIRGEMNSDRVEVRYL
ncbi:MAG: hypothetical protein A2Z04_03125 [Chloroflexi bacterium RBG_16_57_9]|nr:MAG: hypothetical protein A2Z04_03125 [Chloroflexi bacterium RBG_16_57_9]